MSRLALASLLMQLATRRGSDYCMVTSARRPRSKRPPRIGTQAWHLTDIYDLFSQTTYMTSHFFIKLSRLYTSSIYIQHYINKQDINNPSYQAHLKFPKEKEPARSLQSIPEKGVSSTPSQLPPPATPRRRIHEYRVAPTPPSLVAPVRGLPPPRPPPPIIPFITPVPSPRVVVFSLVLHCVAVRRGRRVGVVLYPRRGPGVRPRRALG